MLKFPEDSRSSGRQAILLMDEFGVDDEPVADVTVPDAEDVGSCNNRVKVVNLISPSIQDCVYRKLKRGRRIKVGCDVFLKYRVGAAQCGNSRFFCHLDFTCNRF